MLGEVKYVLMYFVHTLWLKIIELIYEVGNVQAVMDGDLDGFIESYLKMK